MSAIDRPLNATEEQILDEIRRTVEWPLTVNLTPGALRVVERAVRSDLIVMRGSITPQLNTELLNLANTIRAHMQHIAVDQKEKAARLAAVEDDPLLK